jgi:hypothetical protein
MEQSPFDKLKVKKYLAFYGTLRFITVLTRAHDWSLS